MSDYSSSSGSAKKIAIIIIALVAFGIAALGVLFYFSNKTPIDTGPKPLSREEIFKRQIAEMSRLRQVSSLGPLTEKEQKKQIEELNKLRKQSEAKY